MSDLAQRKCQPCEGGVSPLKADEIALLMKRLKGWSYTGSVLTKTFEFRNYHETMAFVNATAWISQREDHHPDLSVSYNKCRVDYITHAIGGLSENDFICAAKIDSLFEI
ncbi:MAG: 4a-hydroxytetrahydrobiopterin dehydratase [Burkholderiales bacterium]|nr:4a-hydroxytetrahydrobiopterin dehydratase [Burkholderiales bacterium]